MRVFRRVLRQTTAENTQARDRAGEADHYVPGQGVYEELSEDDRRAFWWPRSYYGHPFLPDSKGSHGHGQSLPGECDGIAAESAVGCDVIPTSTSYHKNHRIQDLTGVLVRRT